MSSMQIDNNQEPEESNSKKRKFGSIEDQSSTTSASSNKKPRKESQSSTTAADVATPEEEKDEKNQESVNLAEKKKNIETQLSLFEIAESDSEFVKKNKSTFLEYSTYLISKNLLDGTSFQDYIRVGEMIQGGFGLITKHFLKVEANNPIKNFKAIKRMVISLKNKLFFLKEITMLLALNHKNVIKIEKIFFKRDEFGDLNVCIVMPWFENTFISWILGTQEQQGSIHDLPKNIRSFEEVRNILISILQGINAIHSERIIHLDIKFENILVRENQQIEELFENKPKYEAVIADLGLGKRLSDISSTFGGTAAYIAPEILKFGGKKELLIDNITDEDLKKKFGNLIDKSDFFTPKADIYSFGVMLYKIFIHETDDIDKTKINKQKIKQRISQIFPNDKNNISEIPFDDIEDVLMICLENEVSNRPQASNLLFEHPFFNYSITKCPKQYFQIQKLKSIASHSIVVEENPSFDELFSVGLNYLEGKNGYPIDLKKAREVFQNLSTSDNKWNVATKYVTGWMLSRGFGGNIDIKKGKEIMKGVGSEAKRYFELLIEDDNLGFFSFFIAYLYYLGAEGIKMDNGNAMEFFQKSSQKCNSFAYDMLGRMYLSGYGVAKDEMKAFQFYKLSAELCNCDGQNNLGFMYRNGTGTQRDYVMAAKYHQLSADQGYCWAQKSLALLYKYGDGVKMDKVKATQLYKLAADQGLAVAQYFFALQCMNGSGIEKDLGLAKEHFEKAAAQGDEDAKNKLKELE